MTRVRTFGRSTSISSLGLSIALAGALTTGTALGQAPDEVDNLRVDGSSTLSWDPAAGAAEYNVYRGVLSEVANGAPPRCHGVSIAGTSFASPEHPGAGEGFAYLATGVSSSNEEGTPGSESGGPERALLGTCATVVRNHVLNRVGHGWSEWTRDRVDALGLQGYIDEQLDPASIDESTNTELANRKALLEPPEFWYELIGLRIVNGVYARRQLEEQAAFFWANHLNTDHIPILAYFLGLFPDCNVLAVPWCDPAYPNRSYREAAEEQWQEIEAFRDLAFNGTFRDLLDVSSKSPAMIYYLNTNSNVAGAPNENYARELMELHSMGVDGGYTQTDVEELARVFTGWNVCKKNAGDEDDPLAPCEGLYWREDIPGDFVANFDPGQHDCGQKTLFAGTPQETIIADTCGNPVDGVDDAAQALDAIADHPSTAAFVAKKLIQAFVTENPSQATIDAVVAEWNDLSNPAGRGDLREVLRAVLGLPEFQDPDRIGGKIRTPLEQIIAGFRATRGKTDGITAVYDYLFRMSMLPHLNAIPTGYSEIGADWLDSNNLLERQNLGMDLTATTDNAFGSDPVGLLQANGVSTAPGNSAAIVDFFIDVLFGGAITPAERQAAIDYLDTDDDGLPSPYDDARIVETVGFLMGYPQFLEQ